MEEKTIKANCLVWVVTRIDYDDQIKISEETLIQIKDRCQEGYGISQMKSLPFDIGRDFSTDDAVMLRSVTKEYLETLVNRKFYNEFFEIEVNQFYLSVKQRATKAYTNYMESHFKLVADLWGMLMIPSTQILRTSIKKVDELYYSDLSAMKEIFKPEILQLDIFGEEQNWNTINACSQMNQNFSYGDYRVNFSRFLQRGKRRFVKENEYEDVILFRILMTFEVYQRDDGSEPIEFSNEKFVKMNEQTEKLFVNVFNDKIQEKLFEDGDLNEYERR